MEAEILRDLVKQRNRKPSIKQTRALKAYLGGNGGKTKKESLLEAGYSEKIAENPDRVFGSRAIKNLMARKGLAEEDLLSVLQERVHSSNENVQLKALDMSFKLLGSYAPRKTESKNDHRVGIFSMSELRRTMKEKGIEVTDKN